MRRILGAQTCSSCLVLGAFIASEINARMLLAHPDSAFAWYLDREWFRLFEYARIAGSPVRMLFGPASLPVALLLLGATWLAWRVRARFAVGLAANLSFMFAVGCALAWVRASARGVQTTSLVPLGLSIGSDTALIAVMLAASCLGVLACHASFFVAILSERRVRPCGAGTAPASLPQRKATSVLG